MSDRLAAVIEAAEAISMAQTRMNAALLGVDSPVATLTSAIAVCTSNPAKVLLQSRLNAELTKTDLRREPLTTPAANVDEGLLDHLKSKGLLTAEPSASS